MSTESKRMHDIKITSFPVICFWREFIRIRSDEESLTTTTMAGLKNGMFTELLIIDLNGCGYKVKAARKLHGVGLLWGYNIFLNQRIKVELQYEDGFRDVPLYEIKDLVFRSFRKWHGWSTQGDFKELQADVINAISIAQIINILS